MNIVKLNNKVTEKQTDFGLALERIEKSEWNDFFFAAWENYLERCGITYHDCEETFRFDVTLDSQIYKIALRPTYYFPDMDYYAVLLWYEMNHVDHEILTSFASQYQKNVLIFDRLPDCGTLHSISAAGDRGAVFEYDTHNLILDEKKNGFLKGRNFDNSISFFEAGYYDEHKDIYETAKQFDYAPIE